MVSEGTTSTEPAGKSVEYAAGPGFAETQRAPQPPEFQPYQQMPFPGQTSTAYGTVGTAAGLASTARPSELPKPPKGRLFVGTVLLACFTFAAYTVWNTFLRYRAYGTVSGQIVAVHAPWEGVLQTVSVREGERVRQGQLLATVNNIELEQRYSQFADELKVAQAALSGERSRLKTQSGWNIHRHQDAVAKYYEAWGQLLAEKAELSELELGFSRVAKLHAAGAATKLELDHASLAFQGKKEKAAKLTNRLLELKKRVDFGGEMANDITPQLAPFVAKIEALQSERKRLQQRLAQGQLRAAADGLVIQRNLVAGEFCRSSESVLTILEEGTLEVVLYVPQNKVDAFAPGDRYAVTIDPYPTPVPCSVTRLGDRFVPAPEHIERYYRSNQKLLPVYLRPPAEYLQWMALRVGGVVKLPYYAKRDSATPRTNAAEGF